MVYVVDTHSLVWYFEGGEKLGAGALEIIRCIIYPLDVSIVELMPLELEIHDAIICATALLYRDVLAEGANIITRDSEIVKSGLVEIVW